MDPRIERHSMGFWQLRHKPTADELKEYYADRYYQQQQSNYRKSYPPNELNWIQTKLIQKHAAVTALIGDKPGSMLDIGCGEGFAMAYFCSAGWSTSGIDYSEDGMQRMNPDMCQHLQTGDVFQLLNEVIATDRRYNLVWLSNVLEHVLDPINLLNCLKKIVSPNGLVVVTVPNDGTRLHDYLHQASHINEHFWIASPDHISYFDTNSLRQAVEKCGWKCERIISEFPIDWFLAHPGSNYISDRSKGNAAHIARIELDRLIGEGKPEIVNNFYENMASLGMGRQLTAYIRPF